MQSYLDAHHDRLFTRNVVAQHSYVGGVEIEAETMARMNARPIAPQAVCSVLVTWGHARGCSVLTLTRKHDGWSAEWTRHQVRDSLREGPELPGGRHHIGRNAELVSALRGAIDMAARHFGCDGDPLRPVSLQTIA